MRRNERGHRQNKVLLNSVPVYSFLFSATKSVSTIAWSHKSFIYRFYAESPANPFIYRIYESAPGCGGTSATTSRTLRLGVIVACRFFNPLFSYSYELLFPEALYFDNHARCPRVSPRSKTLSVSESTGVETGRGGRVGTV
jgi:hypothetical protein